MEIKKADLIHKEIVVEFIISEALERRDLTLDPLIVSNGVLHLLEHPTDGAYYIAEMQGTIVGYMMIFFEWSDWRGGNFYYIESAYTKKEFRNQGVLKALFQRAYQDAENEKSAIRMITDKNDSTVIEIFKKLGLGDYHYTVLEVVFRA